MKKAKLRFVKKVLSGSLFLQLVLAHILASYLTWPIYLLSDRIVFGETGVPLKYFIQAPYYVPHAMLYVAAEFIQRLPFFDVMPPLGPSITLWLSYLVLLPVCICLTVLWALRMRTKILAAEVAETGRSPAEVALRQKRFRRRLNLCILLVLIALVGGRLIRGSTLLISAPDVNLAYIPAGEFLMGAPPTDEYRYSGPGKEPEHKVRISEGFYMSVTEITQGQWRAVMRYNPSEFEGDDLPVENVSWYDAVRFCKRLSETTGKRYRLPTEAEWEYACRAGTQARFYFGDDPNLLDEYAWYFGNSDGRAHPVGQKKPNAFGLYDMLGNVAEWCSDRFDDGYYVRSPGVNPHNTDAGIFRVYRGGSWWGYSLSTPLDYGCAERGAVYPSMRHAWWGFRVVMEAK